MLRRTPIGSLLTRWPLTIPSPLVALSSVARKRIVVLLPAPLGPIKPNISPGSIFKFKQLTATSSP